MKPDSVFRPFLISVDGISGCVQRTCRSKDGASGSRMTRRSLGDLGYAASYH